MTKLVLDFKNLRQELPKEHIQSMMESAKAAKGFLFAVISEDLKDSNCQISSLSSPELAAIIIGIEQTHPEIKIFKMFAGVKS